MMHLTDNEKERIFVKTGDWNPKSGLSLDEYYLEGIVDKIKKSSTLEGIGILRALLKAKTSIPELNTEDDEVHDR